MGAEATLAIYIYLGVAVMLVLAVIIVRVLLGVKQMLENADIFIKLVIGLYEQERQKNEKTDEGGFCG